MSLIVEKDQRSLLCIELRVRLYKNWRGKGSSMVLLGIDLSPLFATTYTKGPFGTYIQVSESDSLAGTFVREEIF